MTLDTTSRWAPFDFGALIRRADTEKPAEPSNIPAELEALLKTVEEPSGTEPAITLAGKMHTLGEAAFNGDTGAALAFLSDAFADGAAADRAMFDRRYDYAAAVIVNAANRGTLSPLGITLLVSRADMTLSSVAAGTEDTNLFAAFADTACSAAAGSGSFDSFLYLTHGIYANNFRHYPDSALAATVQGALFEAAAFFRSARSDCVKAVFQTQAGGQVRRDLIKKLSALADTMALNRDHIALASVSGLNTSEARAFLREKSRIAPGVIENILSGRGNETAAERTSSEDILGVMQSLGV